MTIAALVPTWLQEFEKEAGYMGEDALVVTVNNAAEYCGVYFGNPSHVDRRILRLFIDPEIRKLHPDSPVLEMDFPCGNKVVYQECEDIPLVDVSCPCGDPKHWFVKYEALTEADKKPEKEAEGADIRV